MNHWVFGNYSELICGRINDKSIPVRQAAFSVLELATLLRSVKTYVELQVFIYMPAVLDVSRLEGNRLILFFMQVY